MKEHIEYSKFVDLEDIFSTENERKQLMRMKDIIIKTLLNDGRVVIPGLGVVALYFSKVGKKMAHGGIGLRADVKLDESLKQRAYIILKNEGKDALTKR